ncbi:MAG: PRC-barrel domain-containing protein [Armatimonadota bacterium]
MRRISSLKGLSVIASSEGVDLGTVSEVIIDLAEGVMEGLIVRSGSTDRGIKAQDIEVIGADAVMVKETSAAKPLSQVPDLANRRRGSESKPPAVVTSSGQKLGMVGEIYIDPKEKTITRFEISGGLIRDLTDGTLSFPVVEGMTHGRDIVLIPEEVIAGIDSGEGGLRGAWAKVAKQLKEEYSSASKRAEHLYKESARSVQSAVTEAREKSRELSDSVSEKIEQAREAAAEKETPPAESARELEEQQVSTDVQPEVDVVEGSEDTPVDDSPGEAAIRDDTGPEVDADTNTAGAVEKLERKQIETEPKPRADLAEADDEPCDDE